MRNCLVRSGLRRAGMACAEQSPCSQLRACRCIGHIRRIEADRSHRLQSELVQPFGSIGMLSISKARISTQGSCLNRVFVPSGLCLVLRRSAVLTQTSIKVPRCFRTGALATEQVQPDVMSGMGSG